MNIQPSPVLKICFPEEGQIRIRKVATRSRARTKGKLPSFKAGRMVEYESINERNVFLHLEIDPTVVCFAEQPCRIVYMEGLTQRDHFPDVLVTSRGGKEFWEVKSVAEAKDPDFLQRTKLMQALSTFGYGYRVAVAEDFSKQPRLYNVAKLVQFGQRPATPLEREAFRVHFSEHRAITWRDASQGRLGTRSREVLCRLVMEGHIAVDLDRPWTLDTAFLLEDPF